MLNGIFTYALEKELIKRNPMTGMKVSMTHIRKPEKKEQSEVVFTNAEKDLLRNTIKQDTANFKTSVGYAILLAFQLGLRVSELVALKWSDIKDKKIHIQREEIIYDKYDDNCKLIERSHHEIVDRTKSYDGNRFLPLTPTALKILEDVQAWNTEHNIHSDFIFADKNGNHFNRQRINSMLYHYCEVINIDRKSSHKIRKSVITQLLMEIENKKSVQIFAGHKHIETTLSYYYDTSSEEEFYTGMCACL